MEELIQTLAIRVFVPSVCNQTTIDEIKRDVTRVLRDQITFWNRHSEKAQYTLEEV